MCSPDAYNVSERDVVGCHRCCGKAECEQANQIRSNRSPLQENPYEVSCFPAVASSNLEDIVENLVPVSPWQQ